MKRNKENIPNQTLELLKTLKETQPRDSRYSKHGRARFLAEARYHQKTVSTNPFQRLIKWISYQLNMVALNLNTFRKEHSIMFSAISSIVLVFAVLLGGSGLTAYAAQDSLPDEPLYSVKLFIEDARYSLTSDPEAQVDLLVSFTNNRVDEAVALTQQGKDIGEDLIESVQAKLQTMLQLAASMDGEGTEGALQHIRTHLITREQLMTMLGQPEDEDVDPTLEQLQARLENTRRLAEAGLEDFQMFKLMFFHNQEETPGSPSENANGPGNEDIEQEEAEVLDEGTSGNADPGNADPGNTDPGNADPGNTDPGNTDPGNTDPGNTDPGNTDPGNTDPGNPDPGTGEPGDPDPGDPDPGDPDPGDPDPGDPGPGDDDPGNGDTGNGPGGSGKP